MPVLRGVRAMNEHAGIVVLFTARYPKSIVDRVMGIIS
jgi:hypothetical protein